MYQVVIKCYKESKSVWREWGRLGYESVGSVLFYLGCKRKPLHLEKVGEWPQDLWWERLSGGGNPMRGPWRGRVLSLLGEQQGARRAEVTGARVGRALGQLPREGWQELTSRQGGRAFWERRRPVEGLGAWEEALLRERKRFGLTGRQDRQDIWEWEEQFDNLALRLRES